MSMTITFDSTILAELEAEALTRDMSSEQVVREVVENYLQRTKNIDPEYDALFRRKYEEGMADYEAGRIRTNEEVEKDAQVRRQKLKAMIASRK